VLLGRRDSTTASYSGANANLPSPDEDVAELAAKFAAQGLSITDLVTLSGSYVTSLAFARNISQTFADDLRLSV
jgi:peroxidase